MTTTDNIKPRRSFRLFRGKDKSSQKAKKTVSFDLEETPVHVYPAPEGDERDVYYPQLTEKEVLMEFRKNVMSGYMKGSANFKDSVEKLYAGARKNYNESELSSGEFSIESVPDEEFVHKVVASEIRGLEELYCSVISDHRGWAVKRVVQSQREKKLRKQLPSIAATVSTRSKNFARLVALGDAEEAKKISTAHAA